MDNDFERSTFKIIKDGEEIECEALFEFTSGDDEKNYMVYTTYSADKKGNIEVHAGVFNPENESGELEPVDSEEEWIIVEQFLESISEEEDDSGQGAIEEIKKNWIQSILYYKYIITKEEEKIAYNNMNLPIGYKREYNKPNKYKLKKIVVRAPEIIEVINKKKEKKVTKPVIEKEIKKEEKKFKPSQDVSPVHGIKNEKKKSNVIDIMEKASNGENLSDAEKRQLDEYLEKKIAAQNKAEEKTVDMGRKSL